MFLGFDHLILTVSDLDRATSDFEALGFRVTCREDADPAPFRNRLVCFADGSYIELVVFHDPAFAATHRFAPLLEEGDGWVEAVLLTDSIEDDAARLSAAGLPFHGPRSMEKPLADGQRWSLSVLVPGRGYGHPALPMLAQDLSDHTLRVPDHSVIHPNNAVGTAGIALLVRDVDAASAQIGTLLSTESIDIPPPEGAADARRLTFGARHVDVLAPAPGSALDDHLARRGEGLLEIRILGGPSRELVASRARLTFV